MNKPSKYIREQILGECGQEILLVFAGAPTAKTYREIEAFAAWKAERMEKLAAQQAGDDTPGVAAAEAPSSGEATTDQLLELAGALEQRRGLAIVDSVTALATGYHDGAFRAGFETACEEITLRLRTEVWDGCLPPVDAPKAGPSGVGATQDQPLCHQPPMKDTPA